MVKQPNKGGTSRVRFIMLEAEGPEGDLAQIAQAIQNALRPSQQGQRLSPPAAAAARALAATPVDVDGSLDNGDDTAEIEVEAEAPVKKVRGEPRNRRPTVPDAHEFDAEAVASWRAFADGVPVENEVDRYLLVAAWLHDTRNKEPVTASHVYSCYRLMKWSVNIPDFGSHLRAAKHRKFLNSAAGKGEYSITQLGLQKVADLKAS